MAYRLDDEFQRGAAVFSVEQVVDRELKVLVGPPCSTEFTGSQ